MLNQIYPTEFVRNRNKLIHIGLNFVRHSFEIMFVSEIERRHIAAEKIKNDVLEFIREKKGATVHEISDEFNIPLHVALYTIQLLDKEKKIKLA